MRPDELKTKIFLDGGDPVETAEIKELLGFLDGQTTNPTLVGKNPQARKRLEQGMGYTEKELLDFYRLVVNTIADTIPQGSISVEVFADAVTTAEEMLRQGREMFTWIPNAQVKFPTSREGLRAAGQAVSEGMRVNMTLCFRDAGGRGLCGNARRDERPGLRFSLCGKARRSGSERDGCGCEHPGAV